MGGYGRFAQVYDCLMKDAQYKKRTSYLLRLFKKHGKVPERLLDLACGTGGFSNEMALRGIEVIGVDMSEEMLAAARENSAESGTDVLYLCQKAQELDLYGTVDGAICCLDSINHITDIKALSKAFDRVSLFLEPGCLFIFDVNTLYKHEEILGDNTFVIEQDNVYCVWRNRYNRERQITEMALDFFVEDSEGMYRRFSEDIEERVYSDSRLYELLEKSGFSVEAVYGDLTEEEPDGTCQRKIFVAKKI